MSIRDILDAEEAASISPKPGETNLPAGFWASHDILTHIRDAAWQSMCSPDAVFASLLALVGSRVPHEVGIDSGIGASPTGTSMLVALVGPPGSGKSEALAVAQAILNDRSSPLIEPDHLPLGSGEGIAEAFMGMGEETDPVTGKVTKVRKQVTHNVFFSADEGQKMVTTGLSRTGATVFPTLRSMWSGKTLGEANASGDRKRVVPSASYHACLVVGFQPQTMAPLYSDAEMDAGTPQRFLLASARDPGMPRRSSVRRVGQLDWEMAHVSLSFGSHFPRRIHVDPVISSVIEEGRYGVHSGSVTLGAYDQHRNLLRLKVATLVGLLLRYRGSVEPFMVSERDWELAGAVLSCSEQVRAVVLDAAAAVRERELAEVVDIAVARAVGVTKAVAETRDERDVARVLAKVKARPGSTMKELKDLFASRVRPPMKDVLDALVADGQVEMKSEAVPASGTEKVTYWPK